MKAGSSIQTPPTAVTTEMAGGMYGKGLQATNRRSEWNRQGARKVLA